MCEEMNESGKMAALTEMMTCVLNGLNIAIYVSDMSSKEVLYANAELQQVRGGDPLTGKVCWKALKDRNKRCECCPVTYLLKNPGKSYGRELNIGEQRLLVHDSIIPWLNGKLAHMQYTVDITEYHRP